MKNGYNNFGGGGAIRLEDDGDLAAKQYIFTGNCVADYDGDPGNGGAISNQNGRADIEGCTFLSNTAVRNL
jgi:hypothetical protein